MSDIKSDYRPSWKRDHDMPTKSSHGFGGDVRDLLAGDFAARDIKASSGHRFPGHMIDRRGTS